MGHYIGPVCRLCRRCGEKLALKGERCLTPKCIMDKKGQSSGGRAGGRAGGRFVRRRRLSDRGLQLQEKQKARYTYGLMERQFRKLFDQSAKSPGVTGEKLLELLERQLHNVIFRLGLADSRRQARQLVGHGMFLVNGRRADISSILVKPGDEITWRARAIKTEYYKQVAETIKGKSVPIWLSLDKEKLSGKVLSLPAAADIETTFVAQSIVEYYSR